MIITDEIIDNISELSKLNLTKSEKAKVKKDLEDILNFMGTINTLDKSIEININQDLSNTNPLREDIAGDSLDRDLLLKNAPDKKDSFFKVPKLT